MKEITMLYKLATHDQCISQNSRKAQQKSLVAPLTVNCVVRRHQFFGDRWHHDYHRVWPNLSSDSFKNALGQGLQPLVREVAQGAASH